MSGFKVLLVDDEEELVSTVVERLELRKISAAGVTSGDEALERLSDEAFDVLVVDVKMPGLGGLELLRTVKRTHPSARVVLMTGHGSTEDSELGRRLGAFAYLQKPVDLDELIETIRAAAHAGGGEGGDGH